MTGALAVVYGAYFAIVGRWLTVTPAADIVYQPLLIVAIVPLAEGATRIVRYRRGT
jgi:hypothetical protein